MQQRKGMDFFDSFLKAEDRLGSSTIKREPVVLDEVAGPFMITRADTSFFRTAPNEIFYGLFIANAGNGSLEIQEITYSGFCSFGELVWGALSIPNDGKFHALFFHLLLAKELRSRATLFVLNSNAINKPHQSILFESKDENYLHKEDDGRFILPVFSSSLGWKSQSFDFKLILENIDKNAEYLLGINQIASEEITVWGKTSLNEEVALWGQNRLDYYGSQFAMSFDDGINYYYMKDSLHEFPDVDKSTFICFQGGHCFSELRLTRYQKILSLYNCTDRNLNVHLHCDARLLSFSMTEIHLNRGESTDIPLYVNRNELHNGMNSCEISFFDIENKIDLAHLRVNIIAEQKRPVIYIENDESIRIKNHVRGSEVQLSLVFYCEGKGQHLISVKNIYNGEYKFISLENDSPEMVHRNVSISMDSSTLPGYVKEFPIVIDSGCYLTNKRFLHANVVLEGSVIIKVTPRFLLLRKQINQDKYVPLTFFRTDGRNLDISLSVEEEFHGFLQLVKHRANVWLVRLNGAKRVRSTNDIVFDLFYKDEISQVRATLPVSIES